MAGAMNPIAARGAPESLQYVGRGAPPLFISGGEMQQIIPAVLDRPEWHIVLNNIGDRGWHHKAPRQVQMPIAQTVESRAQIEAQELGDRHAEIYAMRVYSQALQARD